MNGRRSQGKGILSGSRGRFETGVGRQGGHLAGEHATGSSQRGRHEWQTQPVSEGGGQGTNRAKGIKGDKREAEAWGVGPSHTTRKGRPIGGGGV